MHKIRKTKNTTKVWFVVSIPERYFVYEKIVILKDGNNILDEKMPGKQMDENIRISSFQIAF